MKITIYEPKPKPEEQQELCLELEQRDGYVALMAVHPKTGGRATQILTLHERGVMITPYLKPSLGLPLDDKGRVKVIYP